MATRIAFNTVYPDRMKELVGEPTRFPEKLITMIDPLVSHENMNMDDLVFKVAQSGTYDFDFKVNFHPKTTTIRENYEYWKSKEGQLLQPFFWAGRPYHSKQVVFCPEVRLASVLRINLDVDERRIFITTEEVNDLYKKSFISLLNGKSEIDFTKDEGFDHPDHFWMWFNSDFEGAYLELENVEG